MKPDKPIFHCPHDRELTDAELDAIANAGLPSFEASSFQNALSDYAEGWETLMESDEGEEWKKE